MCVFFLFVSSLHNYFCSIFIAAVYAQTTPSDAGEVFGISLKSRCLGLSFSISFLVLDSLVYFIPN